MIQLTDYIWIGNSVDEMHADLVTRHIGAILNVSHDLHATRGWANGIEYAQIGLVDGPGNRLSMYCSAILVLDALLDKYESVLVAGHHSSRALAVVIMYLILKEGRGSEHPSQMHRWGTWSSVLDRLRDKSSSVLDEPHEAHKEACDLIPFGLLEQLL